MSCQTPHQCLRNGCDGGGGGGGDADGGCGDGSENVFDDGGGV